MFRWVFISFLVIVYVWGEVCGNFPGLFNTISPSSGKNTILNSPKHVSFLSCLSSLRNCPSGLVFVSFMSNCIPSTFCVQCLTPNPSHTAWLLLLPFLRSSVLKPVMSFCPSGSHDEVEAGCHPELWNSLRWGIQSARDYWWSRSCSAADKFDVSSAISLILRNISGNMSSHGVIWSGDDDIDF